MTSPDRVGFHRKRLMNLKASLFLFSRMASFPSEEASGRLQNEATTSGSTPLEHTHTASPMGQIPLLGFSWGFCFSGAAVVNITPSPVASLVQGPRTERKDQGGLAGTAALLATLRETPISAQDCPTGSFPQTGSAIAPLCGHGQATNL